MMTALLLGVVLMSSATAAGTKWGGYYTRERVAAIRSNVEVSAVVQGNRNSAVRRAAPWLAMSDEELWDLVPGQNLPRCIDVTMTRDPKTGRERRAGCLVCGDKIFKFGNYPYRVDVLHHPWKIRCPSCKTWFPTNDFGAYWRSARDETGFFNPQRGNRALLFNAEHPEPGDPKRPWGVDDGFGYRAPDGQEYRFIAYYTWKLWNTLEVATLSLAQAYLYTGDRRYAHKAAVLLDRFADAYPDMDWAPYAARGWFHSDGGSRRGKIQGAIWECSDLRRMAEAYDMIKSGLDDPKLYAFLRRQATRYKLPTPKGTPDLLMRNIENRILRCGAEAVFERRIHGNEGMHHSALAWAAIALDQEPDTSRYLDWLFAPDGGHLPAVIMQRMDRDGVGEEGGPGYALSWAMNLSVVAQLLAAYKPYSRHDLYRDFPRFRNAFLAGVRMTVLDYATPAIGDSMATGAIGKVGPNVRQILAAFRACGDPRLAVAAWIRAGHKESVLWIDDEDADPARWAPRVKQAVEKLGERCLLGPDTMNGYGLVSLESGSGKKGTTAWMYYGQNYGHAHRDRLNFGIYSYGLDLAPDLGYPEFAANWPKRNEWTSTTLAHNTVLVNETPQGRSRVGTQTLFEVIPAASAEGVSTGAFCQACEVSSPEVYEATSEYRRLLVFVPLTEAEGYVVDIFRVAGGHDHIYSFHGPPGALKLTGLAPVLQKKGTYAGPDVPFGPGARGAREGFSWLYDVR
ncbi:MAG: heparinase II/III family protein, partial [Armatimonadetes bacterium]|nr:heparinase II/III family protein [Armatimonadota bacterium]